MQRLKQWIDIRNIGNAFVFGLAALLVATPVVLAAVEVDVTVTVNGDDVVDYHRGPATKISFVTTDNCDDLGGQCRPAPFTNAGAGPNPDFLEAMITLVDDGSILTATGTGTGFRTDAIGYVSLIYTNPQVASCSRFPPEQAAHTVNTRNGDNDYVSMFVGRWVLDPDTDNDGRTTGTLNAVKPTPLGSMADGSAQGGGGLAAYQTLGIREPSGFSDDFIFITNDLPPMINPLRACGALV